MTNLANNLTAAAQRSPALVALRCDDQTYTYEEFDRAAARMATLLGQLGVGVGDRVGIMLPNTPAFAIVFYGAMCAGGVAVPMNPLLSAREIEFYLSNTGAKVLFATPAFAGAAREGAERAGAICELVDDETLLAQIADLPERAGAAERADNDTAVVLHTSGTTGHPKGAELTHGGLGRNAEVCITTLFGTDGNDVIMGCLPLFHVFGLTCGLNSAVLAGATLTLIPRFDAAKALQVIERDGVTIFQGVPTMYSALLAAAAELPEDKVKKAVSTLRLCASGGAAIPVQVIRDFENVFGCAILEGYGLSETSPVASFNHPDKPRKAGSVGTPVQGVEMRVVLEDGTTAPQGEPGEIQIRGHNIMKGYWNLPEATAEAINPEGWFSSGDIGKVDEDGYYYIVDRKKVLIIRGGFNVYPREVEEVLYSHPDVAEAVVVGMPHETLGEEVGAAVTLKPGATADADALREYVKGQVAAYKYPRRIWFVDALPKGPTGKLLRREIKVPPVESAN
ncbi:long-chain fatty acid--CoA ligase [Mycobacterium sp. OTB74]|uniref:long-chain-fatty-acid--CoA ligase n=1 Tax=Mycobacterium sp. OTB74 TaxID=1853452 RepID=UPI0024738AC7|nr:long-chain fatty acid--CoA ligase [Mycobacterium sp. OTB74]MDH6243371.1 long-chain acyl-CoA synthetase [Mycobacterium sp. OTB74]